MTHEERMKKALADLESYLKLNYFKLAKKYDLKRTTIAKRH
jgi:hypothetical protein